MKRLLLIPLLLLLFSVAGAAGVGHHHYVHKVATGSVTRASLTLCMLANTSFIDFGVANKLTPYRGCKIVISDSAGKTLTGYVNAAGSGETSIEYISSGSAVSDSQSEGNATTGWSSVGTPNLFESTNAGTPQTGTYHFHINNASGGYRGAELNPTLAVNAGEAWALSTYVLRSSGAAVLLTVYDGNGATILFLYPNVAAYVLYSAHITSATSGSSGKVAYKSNSGNSEFYIDNTTLKRILTPSSTGVYIASTPNGSTLSWANEESGFNRNDASNYTYAIYLN